MVELPAARNTGLQRLELACRGMTHVELAAGIAALPGLRRLDLVGCPTLHDSSFRLLCRCHRLRRLRLEDTFHGMVDRDTLWQLRLVGSIVALRIVNCLGIYPWYVEELQEAFSVRHGRELDVVQQ